MVRGLVIGARGEEREVLAQGLPGCELPASPISIDSQGFLPGTLRPVFRWGIVKWRKIGACFVAFRSFGTRLLADDVRQVFIFHSYFSFLSLSFLTKIESNITAYHDFFHDFSWRDIFV